MIIADQLDGLMVTKMAQMNQMGSNLVRNDIPNSKPYASSSADLQQLGRWVKFPWFRNGPLRQPKLDTIKNLQEIELLVDPLNDEGKETEMPIIRWRRLDALQMQAYHDFIHQCCKQGCEFPKDYFKLSEKYNFCY
jgi:hypothetical protein